MEITLRRGKEATPVRRSFGRVPGDRRTLACDAVVVVGDDAFQASMHAHPVLRDRTVLPFSVEAVIDGPLPVAGGEVLVSADALRTIRAHGASAFPGAARVVVVPAGPDERDPLGPPLSRWQRAAKRGFDLVVATALLLVAAPIIALLAVFVRLTTREPGIFVQERIGQDGRPFRIFKVRTMITADDSAQRAYVRALMSGQAEKVDGMFKLRHDARITGLGRWLRRLSLDELPQLWNVVRGDMSMVGPRPPLPSEVADYDALAWQRLRVKPGITGAWQVAGRCTLPFDEMVQLDVDYWQRWSLWHDITIALRTPIVMFVGRGAG